MNALRRREQLVGIASQLICIQTIAVLILLVSVPGCASTDNPLVFDEAPLYGMIYDKQNRPVKGVRIVQNGKLLGTSDVNGRFFLSKISQGSQQFRFEKAGYESLELEVDFQNRTEVLYINMRSAFDCMVQADMALSQQSFADARQAIDIGIDIDPLHQGLHFLSAILYLKVGDPGSCLLEIISLWEMGRRDRELYSLALHVADMDPEKAREVRAYFLRYPAAGLSRGEWEQLLQSLDSIIAGI